MKIYLDMDGVLVDFITGVHNALYLDYNFYSYPYKLGEWDVFTEIKNRTDGRITNGKIYELTSYSSFWSTLPWTPDGKEILKIVTDAVGKQNRFICSTPMQFSESWSGKIEWLKNAGIHRGIVLMQAPKYLLANSDCVLIDDKDKNVEEFINAGGRAYLIPRPWNKRHSEYMNPFFNDLIAFLKF